MSDASTQRPDHLKPFQNQRRGKNGDSMSKVKTSYRNDNLGADKSTDRQKFFHCDPHIQPGAHQPLVKGRSELTGDKFASNALVSRKASKQLDVFVSFYTDPHKKRQLLTRPMQIPPGTTYGQLLKLAAECLGIPLNLGSLSLDSNDRPLPNSSQIIPMASILPKSTLKLRSRALTGGSQYDSQLIQTNRALIYQIDDSKTSSPKNMIEDESQIPVLRYEHSVSEFDQPITTRVTESTGMTIKRLRTVHGGTLDASRLSAKEKVAIDSDCRLLTDEERLKFYNFITKQRFQTNTSNLEHAIQNQLQRMKELRPEVDLPIIDFHEQLYDQEFISRRSRPDLLMVTVKIPKYEVDESFKIKKDMSLKKVKTYGKATSYLIIYKLCPKTHVQVYVDRQVIREPLVPKQRKQRLYCGPNDLVFWVIKDANCQLVLTIQGKQGTNPEETPIGLKSKLNYFWQKGKSRDEDHYVSLPSAAPTMITAQDRRLLVFSDFQLGEIPSVYFYDVKMQKETHQFKGANMLLGSLQNNDVGHCKNVYYFYADTNLSKDTLTNGNELINMRNELLGKQCESPIVMVAEQMFNNREELQVIDLLSNEDLPSITHSVSKPVVINQPEYSEQWFQHPQNKVTQFRQNKHDYFAVSNNQYESEKMVFYKVENPSKVTCIFSNNGCQQDYMTILPPLKDDTIRLLKKEHQKRKVSILECDTKGVLQAEKNDLVTYSVTELATTQISRKVSENFYRMFSMLLTKPLQALFKEKSEISCDVLDNFMCLFKKAMQSNYKISGMYPLLTFVDQLIPWEIKLTNLADQQQSLVSLDLSQHGSVFCLAQQAGHLSTDQTSIVLLVEVKETAELKPMEVILNKPYQHNALLQPDAIQVMSKFARSLDYLRVSRNSLKTVYLLKRTDGKYQEFSAVTDTEVLVQNGYNLMKRCAAQEERLADVAQVTTGRGDLLFLIENTLTQSSRIIRYQTQHGLEEVYSNSQRIVAFHQSPSNDQVYFENEYETRKSVQPLKYFVLDSACVLSILQEKSQFKFDKIQSLDLKGNFAVEKLVSQLKPYEMVCITERTISARGQVINIYSGNSHNLFEQSDHIIHQSAGQCQPIEQSNKIAFTFNDGRRFQLVVISEPGCRDIDSSIGRFGLSQVKTYATIAENSYLIQFIDYWTLQQNGLIVKIPQRLQEILDLKLWKKTISCLVIGNIFKVILYHELDTQENELGVQKNGFNHSAKILLLSESCEVLKVENIEFCGKESAFQEQLMMNQLGHLLQIQTIKGDDQSENQVQPQIVQLNHKNVIQVVITSQSDLQAVFAGNCVCYVSTDSSQIKIIDVTNRQSEQISIKLKDYGIPGEIRHIIACQPEKLMRTSPDCSLEYSTLETLCNHFEVTTSNNETLVFAIDKKEPALIKRIYNSQEFCKPEKYVEPGFTATAVQYVETEDNRREKISLEVQLSLLPNSQGSIMLRNQEIFEGKKKDAKSSKIIGICRSFALIDIYEFKQIAECLKKKQELKIIDISTLLASTGRQTILSKLSEDVNKIKALSNCPSIVNESKNQGDFALRLPLVLNLRDQIDTEGKSLTSLVQRSLTETTQRDLILSLGSSISDQFCGIDSFNTQEDFPKMFKQNTGQSQKELLNCFRDPKNRLLGIPFPKERSFICIQSSDCYITNKKIKKELEKYDDKDKVQRSVTTRSLEISWFYKSGHNFVAFSECLQKMPNSVYTSLFVQVLLYLYWPQTKRDIIIKQFIPFCTFVILSILSFLYSLSDADNRDANDESSQQRRTILAVIILIAWLYHVVLEVVKLKRDVCKYLKSVWNLIDMISLILTAFVIAASLPQNPLIALETLRPVASVASCALLVKVFDWLRLFESTAFYIKLMQETFQDIRAFMILFLAALAAFGVPMIILNLNLDAESQVVDEIFGFWLANMLLNQYLLALGEFSLDNFASNSQASLCYFFFVCATFISQVTMLNMLIAIMGDTFEKVIENRTVNAIKSKLELMDDVAATMKQRDAKPEEKVFLHVIMPVGAQDDDEEGDEWEGQIKRLIRFSTRHFVSLGKKVDQYHKAVDGSMKKQTDQKFETMSTEMKAMTVQISGLDTKISGMDAKFEGMDVKMTEIMSLLHKKEDQKSKNNQFDKQ